MDDKERTPAASDQPAEKSNTEHLHDALQSSLDERTANAEEAFNLPDLGSVKSEYQKFCDEFGGPVEGLMPTVARSTFARCCREYSLDCILPLLLTFNSDRDTAQRHWPHTFKAIGIDSGIENLRDGPMTVGRMSSRPD
jgi:hypothetical protein